MNRRASRSQRTGQPRCAQLTEKATNFVSLARRSHAAVFPVTPAHGSGDASAKVTATVSPTVKSSTAPTARHSRGGERKRGATTKPTIGTASATPPAALSTTLTLPSISRRARSTGLVSWGGAACSPGVGSGSGPFLVLSLMPNVSDPGCEGHGEHGRADSEDDGRRDEPPADEGDADGHRCWAPGRPRDHVGLGHAVAGAEALRCGRQPLRCGRRRGRLLRLRAFALLFGRLLLGHQDGSIGMGEPSLRYHRAS